MISVIIPAFNEARFIEATLSALQQFRAIFKDVEIVVVDNGSEDETPKLVSSFSDVKLVSLEVSTTVAQARNIGFKMSCGDVVAFIDADIIVTERWWRALIKFEGETSSENSRAIITGCKVGVSQTPSWIERYWFSSFKSISSTYINSGNLISTRDAVDFVGGFNASLRTGEDVDFCLRAKEKNVDLVINEEFHVHHEGYPKTIVNFFRREKWHGTGDLQNISSFFNSKVAIISFLVAFLSAFALVQFCLGSFFVSTVTLITVAVINLVTLCMRIKIKSLFQFFGSFFLNYLYFIGRFFSILNIFSAKNRRR